MTFTLIDLIFTAIFSMIVGCVIGGILSDGDSKGEAVKQGKAEYYLDENHKRQWRWKE